MQSHQSYARMFVVVIRVRYQRRMVQELRQCYALFFGFRSSIHQFLEVLDAIFGSRLVLLFQQLKVAGSVQDALEELSQEQALAAVHQFFHERVEAFQRAQGSRCQPLLKQFVLERFPQVQPVLPRGLRERSERRVPIPAWRAR